MNLNLIIFSLSWYIIIFLQLIQTKNVENISVSEICKKANLNRSTFYANYIDIYDLVEKVRVRMICEFFKAGITAIIKMWLNNNCKETPEEMVQILISEYNIKTKA